MAHTVQPAAAGSITSPKDFWTGVIYILFGAAVIIVAYDYRMGIASRMGPGYFPKVLATILIGIGVISVVRGFTTKGDGIGRIAWTPLVLITLSCVAFGWLLPRLGLVVALAALILISAVASAKFRLDVRSVAAAAALILFCLIVFVAGLGVPMPVFGPWISPYTDPFTAPIHREIVVPVINGLKSGWRAIAAAILGLMSN